MLAILALSLAAGSALSAPLVADPLSKADAAAGWKDLIGTDIAKSWRGFKAPAFPAKGWSVENGVLSIAKGGGGGDLVSLDKFADLELSFEFKLGEKANSGIMWHVDESLDATYMTGPEYQLLEDTTYGVKPTDPHACGALYDLVPPAEGKVMKPAGEWNQGRIYLRNGLLQHWLNGSKVVETNVFGPDGKPTKEWAEKIAASKFKDAKNFGILPTGMIAIQDHGDTQLALRNVHARDLAAPLAGEVSLFNGKDMTGWKAILPGGGSGGADGTMADAWSVRDGAIICKGQPIGYIRTEKKYTNFILRLQWRFDPTKGAGNSGVLLRMIGDDKVWPKSVEAQLESGQAGDFWNIDQFKMTAEKSRTNGRNTKRDPKAGKVERPLGEWNEYEIIADKGLVILKINGVETNRATDVEQIPGYLCLQSEGSEIHFRDIRLVPLD